MNSNCVISHFVMAVAMNERLPLQPRRLVTPGVVVQELAEHEALAREALRVLVTV